jgi:TM2 domain-containing membrane protein YozV
MWLARTVRCGCWFIRHRQVPSLHVQNALANFSFLYRLPTRVGVDLLRRISPPTEIQTFASKKIAAGICGILLGGLGVHKFILGLNTSGAIMLSVSIVGLCFYIPTLAMMIIGLIEGIIYMTKSDEEFFQTYAIQKKEWF